MKENRSLREKEEDLASMRLCSALVAALALPHAAQAGAAAAGDDLALRSFGASGAVAAELQRVQEMYGSAPPIAQLSGDALSPSASPQIRRDALVQLGDMFFYGNQSLATAVNGTLALQLYAEAAALGAPKAQFHVGVALSYGLWGFPLDDAAAMTHYYFAALGGDVSASMALGHRHLLGINAPKTCETAVRYYEVAANRAIELREANESEPAIYDMPHRRLKTVHETQHKKNIPSDAAIVDYYQFSADKGDPEATINLATLYFYGARGLQQDLPRAAALFHKAYELGASGGAYHLGHLYSHGIGVRQDNDTAFRYLQEAANEGNTAAQNELAYMFLHGKGTVRDLDRAVTLFKSAAKQGSMEAFYNLGVLHMQGGGSGKVLGKDPEYEVAHGYFQVAAHQGHTVSSHKLGHMSLHGIGTARSCKNAVESFKMVAERGEWDRQLSQAFKDFKNKDYEASFMKYAVMAQQGYEVAQHNAAYLLDYGFLAPSVFAPAPSLGVEDDEAVASVAVMLYKLAALQGNVDANLKIGDYYYYGKGGHDVDYMKASAHYSLASKRSNSQAMFNLAIMYEHGIGVQQDFFLAKRFFDRSRVAHSDAHVPVALALWKMRWHMTLLQWKFWWDKLVGNNPAPLPAGLKSSPTPARPRKSSESFGIISWLQGWLPSADSVGLSDWSAETLVSRGRELVFSDNFLILVIAVALGAVLYVRSERQNLRDQLEDQLRQQQQQQQEPQREDQQHDPLPVQ